MTTKPPEPINTQILSSFQNQHSKTSSDAFFRYFKQLLKNNSYISTTSSQQKQSQSPILLNQKAIKPKMFSKLAAWMEKMCIQTLNFSYETLEYSLKILKEYLEKSQETPQTLQMLGCVCLHISSKLNQKSIISIDSYIECCLNIFNKVEFEQKEAQVYEKVAWTIPFLTICDASDFLEYEVLSAVPVSQTIKIKLNNVISQLIKDLQFLQIEPLTIAVNLWTEVLNNPQIQFNKQQFLLLIKERKFQY